MIDGREFLKGLDLADRRIREAAKVALGQAALDVMDDAIADIPTVPIEKGTLRASASAILADGAVEELLGTSEEQVTLAVGADPPTPAFPPTGMGEPGALVAIVGFNTPYAAYLHEHPEFTFTEPGSGGKFLESKILPKKDELMALIAGRIKASLEGGR